MKQPDADNSNEVIASEEVHEAILSLAMARNHDDVPVMIEDSLDRITTDLQVVRQAIMFHEEP